MEFEYSDISDLLTKIYRNEYTKEEQDSLYDNGQILNRILNYLQIAINDKDKDAFANLIFLVFYFELESEELFALYKEQLLKTWHHKHEDLATLIDSYRSESSVECLRKAINLKLPYLRYKGEESIAFETKCIWALGNIGSSRAKEALEEIQHKYKKSIAQEATKQLERIKERNNQINT